MSALIENKRAEMELDSGSPISALPIKFFRRIFQPHKMFSPNVQLRTATGKIFKLDDYLKADVSYDEKTKIGKLHLIKEGIFALLIEIN